MRRLRVALALILLAIPVAAGADTPWSDAVDALARDRRGRDPERAQQALDGLGWVFDELARMQVDPAAPRDLHKARYLCAIELARVPARARGAVEDTLALLGVARAEARVLDDHELGANVEQRVAVEQRERGRLREARATLERALSEFPRAVGMRPHLLVELAELERARGNWNGSLWLAAEADCARIPDFAPHASLAAGLLGLRAHVALDLGLPDRAAASIAEEMALAQSERDLQAWITALQRRVALDLATDAFESACKRVEEERTRDHWPRVSARSRARLLVQLGRAQAQLGSADPERSKQASATLVAALEDPELGELERALAELALAEIEIRAPALDAAEARLGSVRARLAGSLSEERPDELAHAAALEAEIGLARAESTARLGARLAELETVWHRLLARWERVPRRSGGVAPLHYSTPSRILSALVELRARLFGDEGALTPLFEIEAQSSLTRILAGSASDGADVTQLPIDLARLRETLLPLSGNLLVFLPAPERTHLFVVDARGVALHRLPPAAVLEPLRRDFAEAWSAPDATDARRSATGARLADALLPAEVRARLVPGSAWSIVSVGLLGDLPFEALPVAGEFFGVRCALARVPSMTVGCELAARARSARFPWAPRSKAASEPDLELAVVVASDTADVVRARWPKAVALPFGARESKALIDGFPPGRAIAFTGDKARYAHLVATSERTAALTLVAHGVHDPARERPSGLALVGAPAGDVLWCADVERLRAPPLVVLGACGAARGPLRRGDDGVADLGGAFLAAGAQTVVLSRDDLDYRATLELLGAFHRRLARHSSPARALREARAELLSTRRIDAATALSFFVFGLGDPNP